VQRAGGEGGQVGAVCGPAELGRGHDAPGVV
jgi:hypothetical protein